jgi:hypothetical protein
MKRLLCLFVAMLILNAAAVYLLRDDWVLVIILSIIATEFVTAPLLLIGIVLMLLGRAEKRKAVLPWGRGMIAIAVLAISLWSSAFVCDFLYEKDMVAAKAYCESLIPKLQAYKSMHGDYPADIAVIDSGNARPRLLKKWQFYSVNAGVYVFTISDARSIGPLYWEYDPNAKSWHQYD